MFWKILIVGHLIGWFFFSVAEGYAAADSYRKGNGIKDSEAICSMLLAFTWEFSLIGPLIGSVIWSLRNGDKQ